MTQMDEMRDLLISTVLVIVQTEPCRRSFICGYNDAERPAPASSAMKNAYRLGRKVRAAVLEKDHG